MTSPDEALQKWPAGLVLDSKGASRAIALCVMAGLVWYFFFAFDAVLPLEPKPLSILGRFLGIALTARALVELESVVRGLVQTGRMLRASLRLSDSKLEIVDQGPRSATLAPTDFVAVVSSPIRVYAILTNEAAVERRIPIYLDLTAFSGGRPGLLAETLMRWIRPQPQPAAPAPRLPSQIYAADPLEQTDVAIPHSYRWLLRGPHLSSLFGITLLLFAAFRQGPLLAVGVVATLASPCWVLWKVYQTRAHARLAGILSPEGLVIRDRRGADIIAWGDVTKIEHTQIRRWSVLTGLFRTNVAVLRMRRGSPVTIDETNVALPYPVLVALLKTYRKRSTDELSDESA